MSLSTEVWSNYFFWLTPSEKHLSPFCDSSDYEIWSLVSTCWECSCVFRRYSDKDVFYSIPFHRNLLWKRTQKTHHKNNLNAAKNSRYIFQFHRNIYLPPHALGTGVNIKFFRTFQQSIKVLMYSACLSVWRLSACSFVDTLTVVNLHCHAIDKTHLESTKYIL